MYRRLSRASPETLPRAKACYDAVRRSLGAFLCLLPWSRGQRAGGLSRRRLAGTKTAFWHFVYFVKLFLSLSGGNMALPSLKFLPFLPSCCFFGSGFLGLLRLGPHLLRLRPHLLPLCPHQTFIVSTLFSLIRLPCSRP